MKILLQRTLNAKVVVENNTVGEIEQGIVLFVGFCFEDINKSIDQYKKIIHKILLLRIFEDENQKMNFSVLDKKFQILIVSQFTLCGDPYKGNRPSFTNALKIDLAEIQYNEFIKLFKQEFLSLYKKKYQENCNPNDYIQQGKFRANMKIYLIHDGPVTFFLEF